PFLPHTYPYPICIPLSLHPTVHTTTTYYIPYTHIHIPLPHAPHTTHTLIYTHPYISYGSICSTLYTQSLVCTSLYTDPFYIPMLYIHLPSATHSFIYPYYVDTHYTHHCYINYLTYYTHI